jgi:hypothetical protein
MTKRVTLDLVTFDPRNDEFVLYLVEDGPWPDSEHNWAICLRRIQARVYDAMDVAIDGHLARQFPDSTGKKVRVEVDSPSGCPCELEDLIAALNVSIARDGQYRHAISVSPHIRGLRIVTGRKMGRFKSDNKESKKSGQCGDPSYEAS